MAKTGLNIGADATIVASAGALAKAQNPFDMSKINQNLAETHAATMKSIGDTATNYINSIKELNKPLKDKWTEMQTMIADGTVESQQERDEMQAQLDIFREEMRGIPMGKKGQKQRNELIYKINRYMKAHQADATAGESFSNTIVDESLYNAAQTEHEHPGFHALSTNIVDHLKNPNAPLPEGFSVKKNDQGVNEYAYNQGDIELSGTLSDLDGMLSRTDYEGITEFEGVFGKVYENVKNNNLKTKDQVISDLHDGAMQALNKNPNLYKSQIHQTVKGENTTFYKALMDPTSPTGQKIFRALATLNPELDTSGPNDKPDGIIDKNDFATKQNYDTLVNRLINPGAADTELAHELLTEFYIESEGMMAYDEGDSHRTYQTKEKKKNEEELRKEALDGWGKTHFANYTYKTPGEEDKDGTSVSKTVYNRELPFHANKFNEIEAAGNGSWEAYNGTSYFMEDGLWYMQKPGQSEKAATRGDVINDLGWGTMMPVLGIPPNAPAAGRPRSMAQELDNFNPDDWSRTEDGNFKDGKGNIIYAGSGKYKPAGGFLGLSTGPSTQSNWGATFIGERYATPSQAQQMVDMLIANEKAK